MKKIIFVSAMMALALSSCSLPSLGAKTLKPDEAKAKAEKFINENLVQADSKVTVKDLVEENGLYKMKVVLANGQEIDSYISKDGGKFFPQVMDIADLESKNAGQKDEKAAEAEQPKAAVKSDKPKVELFVMSHCPYGTQIEKGIIPAVEALGSKIDFTLKFCDYAMHGEKELDEQTKQYCIQKNEPKKLLAYLKCFLKAGDSASCVKSSGLNTGKLDACIKATDKEFKTKETFKDKSKWPTGNFPPFNIFKAENDKYGVKGSPTLVVNGAQSASARDAASLLKAICASFNKEPAECKKELSSAAPSAGFGEGTGGAASSDAGCATE
jgi:hypothetical protein